MINKITQGKTITSQKNSPASGIVVHGDTAIKVAAISGTPVPLLTIYKGDGDPVLRIMPDGRVLIDTVPPVEDGVDTFFRMLMTNMDTRLGGTGYRDAIFDRLLTACRENGGLLDEKDLTDERNCVIIEERLKGKS